MERLTALMHDKMLKFDKVWLTFKTFVKRDRMNVNTTRTVPSRLLLSHLDGLSTDTNDTDDEMGDE